MPRPTGPGQRKSCGLEHERRDDTVYGRCPWGSLQGHRSHSIRARHPLYTRAAIHFAGQCQSSYRAKENEMVKVFDSVQCNESWSDGPGRPDDELVIGAARADTVGVSGGSDGAPRRVLGTP